MDTVLLTEQKTIKIVIVEDLKLTRLGLKTALNKYEDMSVIGDAEDSITGKMMIEVMKPDIVLIDLGLSEENGVEVISKIRAKNKSVKIIALTSMSDNNEVLNVLMSGANAYCTKNIDLEEFVNLIRDVADITEHVKPLVKTLEKVVV